MAHAHHRDSSRRLINEVLSDGAIGVVDELVADGFVGHFPTGDVRGPEALKAQAVALRSAFPDLEMTAEHVLLDGAFDATRWVARGTHEGAFLGVPPTGTRVEWSGIGIHRYEDGGMVEAWEHRDDLRLLAQLGVVDPPGASTEH